MLILALFLTFHLANAELIRITVDLDKPPIRKLPPLFLGHTIDASITGKDEWFELDIKDPKLLAYMNMMKPFYIRFGGTQSDCTVFMKKDRMGHNERDDYIDDIVVNDTLADLPTKTGSAGSSFNATVCNVIREYDLNRLIEFVSQFDARLLYCLNSHQKSPSGDWDPRNSVEVIDHISKLYKAVDWSIGNEPLQAYQLTGKYLGEGVAKLRKILNERHLKEAKIVAPDVSRVDDYFLDLITDTVRSAGSDLNAVSFHQYTLGSKKSDWLSIVRPSILNNIKNQIAKVKQTIKSSPNTDLELWLTETGSSTNGGQEGLSRSYVAALQYADKIGAAAYGGVSHLMRQSLFGGRYCLFNITSGYTPSPEFYIHWLFTRLVANYAEVNVLSFSMNKKSKDVRFYAFHGRVKATMMLINLSPTRTYTFKFENDRLSNYKRTDFFVTSDNSTENTQHIQVNYQDVIFMNETELDSIITDSLQSQYPSIVQVQPLSMVFCVFEDHN